MIHHSDNRRKTDEKIGFDPQKHEEQSKYILEREINNYDKLYLEFGGNRSATSMRNAYCLVSDGQF